MTVVLESNAASVAPIRVPSLGTDVPPAGQVLILSDRDDLMDASMSEDITTLAQDNAFGAGQHSLIVKDGVGNTVSIPDLPTFLANAAAIVGSGPYALLAIGPTGDPIGGDYVGRFEQGTQPSTLQIPDGSWGYWYDTSNLQLYVIRNRGGDFHQVEATIEP